MICRTLNCITVKLSLSVFISVTTTILPFLYKVTAFQSSNIAYPRHNFPSQLYLPNPKSQYLQKQRSPISIPTISLLSSSRLYAKKKPSKEILKLEKTEKKDKYELHRDKVKDVTSEFVAPLAIDEEALGEYCILVTGEEDCLTIPNDDESIDIDKPVEETKILEESGSNELYDDIILPSEGTLTQFIDSSIKYIPLIFPIFAFYSYDEVARVFDLIVEFLSFNTWESVDGKTFQIQTLTPAINGIVVPTVSILFATLSGTTISTLRQRQLDIRTCLNMEANEIRTLQSLVESYPESIDRNSDYQDICRNYLVQYTARLISESQPEAVLSNLEFKGSMDSEMNGFLAQLNKISSLPPTTVTSYMSSYPPPEVAPNPTILSESYGAISRLNSYRSTRISALQSTFPMLHFVIVFALGGSICLAFLMETNQEILLFLNRLQLRTLWTILIGTLAALGVVCYDLSEPFRGSYQIASSIDQLYTIREVLRASRRVKKYRRVKNEYNRVKSESES